jgi:trans-2-enoyl-CoA reductase
MSARRRIKAVVIRGKDSVELTDLDLPALNSDQVLVRVLAAPIHPADLNTIEGKYPNMPATPFVGGREGAGVVEEIGSRVATLDRGDMVLLPPEGGTWREAGVYTAADLVPVPPALSPEQAAQIKINPGTALRMLRDFVPLLPGEWIVQNSANSAVGRAVVQIARHFGWHTVNLVRDPDALEPEFLAAGDVFLADEADAEVGATAGKSIRLGLNAVGGESALRVANAVVDGGTLVTYGAMARQPLRIPNGLLIFRDLHVRGFWLTRWTAHATPIAAQGMLSELLGLGVAGVIRSPVETAYSLVDFAEALAHAGRPRRRGKILFGAADVLQRYARA